MLLGAILLVFLGCSSVIIVPIIVFFSFAAAFVSEEEVSIAELLLGLKEMVNFNEGYAMVFLIAILSFFTSFSMIAPTAISRDGKNAWFNKVVPIKTMTIINAKVFLGIVLGYLPILFMTLVGLFIGIFDIFVF